MFRHGNWHPGCAGNELSKPMDLLVRKERGILTWGWKPQAVNLRAFSTPDTNREP